MKKNHKLFLATLLAAAVAAPTLAAADHPRPVRSTPIGEVGTHSHDAEDYITVSTNQRFERLELRSEGRPVRLDAVDIQFVDGRKFRVDVRETMRSGQRLMIDVPSYSPIKMLVLQYDNPGRKWRAREDARVEVRGVVAEHRRPVRRDTRYLDRTRPARPEPVEYQDTRFQWRGGVYIRVGT